ncbi:histidine phosphatase family protein [Variovorax sp. J22P168]|uniref:histidine phosphatase family protein n=1 Tax=Variovorax jilinensis TaxID=3053513 RepID=UPI002577651D|nr:histidine phosphatase family protein [Variovorax sp. J22P168]MDM0013108.1 histidine phosphatase family protein [Variovorax sp. J22P168]
MKLTLIRHPRTLAEEGLCYGRTDVPVAAELTREVAERVAPALPRDVSMACSPLVRCSGLAAAITELRPDLRARPDPRLAEMDLGQWEEGMWSAIERSAFDAWMRDFADTRAGVDGESTRQFMQRVGAAFDDWKAGGRDAIWVTHAGVIRAVRLLHAGLRSVERSDQWPAEPIAFGEVVVFDVAEGQGASPQGAGVLGL